MQNVFDNRAMFAQFHQSPPRPAPTAVMVDQNLEFQPSSPPRQQHLLGSDEGHEPKPEPPSSEAPRTLPSPDVDQAGFEDAYVQFIFYCNPSIPLSTDTAELRRGFQSMPKTDGKTFDIHQLFGLIKKLEAKEIDTWAQLVIELGVEPPDPAKSQSAQKVQQFAVRLKRWLHAFHIDAFFQYCLGKPGTYLTGLPGAHEPVADTVRDGVPPDEDLALRALLPEWRPKRGRKKADHGDGDFESPAKRLLRASSLTADDMVTPQVDFSAHPQSAYPWGQESNPPHHPWSTPPQPIPRPAPPVPKHEPGPYAGQHSFWVDMPDDSSSTAYPQSAVTPRHSQSLQNLPKDMPQSAHPGLSTKPRKRHGPAVSAAWPLGGFASGKLRGRPPTNRTTQNGPFSTFPANPPDRPTPPRNGAVPAKPTVTESAAATPVTATSDVFAMNKRPGKLQLQVPQHLGGPVRLATPPPKVLLNGGPGGAQPGNEPRHLPERRSSADFFGRVDDDETEMGDDSNDDLEGTDWKRRALFFKKKLKEKEAEIKAMKRRVLEAVM